MTIGFAVNPIDGVRTAYDDSGGGGDPVLVYPGFTDPLEYARTSPLCEALSEEFRLIFADHRGQGRSDKPHDVTSYTLETRINDATAILDALGIERSHYLGFSWGARLGFALGEHYPERFRSLVLCGNQPYEWPTSGPMLTAVANAVTVGKKEGMGAFVESWETAIGERFAEPGRTWMLDNDPLALAAEFQSAFLETKISDDLSKWDIPCLIYAGSDDEMHGQAARAAAEIPGAKFLSLPGHTHFSAERVTELLYPKVRELFGSAR